MAITYTFGELLNIVRRFIPSVVDSDMSAALCNITVDKIWYAYDWRETVDELPPFWLVPGEQDYGAPAVSVPANFLGLRKTWWTDLDATVPLRVEIPVIKDLRLTHVISMPQSICYAPEISKFRIFPRAPLNFGVPRYLIEGTYKIRPTKITPATLPSAPLPFDDMYLPVMIEVIKWAGYQLSGDPRVAEQLAKANYFIDEMAANEGLELGDPAIAPSEPLVNMGWPRWSFLGIPGY